MANISCRVIFSFWWKSHPIPSPKMLFMSCLIRRAERYLEFTNEEKWSKALEVGSFGKLLENEELKERTRAKWAKGNGFFNTALETESPFCVSGMIKSKQGKSCSFWVLSLTWWQQHSKCSCSAEVPYTDPRDFQTYQTTWIWWQFLIWSAHTM